VGDLVEVTRAGEVIPQILGPVLKKGARRKPAYRPPERCPICKSKVEHPRDEVVAYCPNISCPGRILEAIVHFASRGAMDIRGLGYERVRALLDAKLIDDVADRTTRAGPSAALAHHRGFAEKSARQLLDAIDASKRQPLSILLYALGIRHVGAQGAKLLARHFGAMAKLAKAPEAAINEIRGVGPAIAEAVAGFFATPANRKLIERLAKLGLTMTEPVGGPAGSGPLAGQTYVITGTLPSLSRDAATTLIEAAGGHVSDSVSKQTTALVVGEDAGSKLAKAQTLGVPVISETELLRRATSKT
jgi:DNA ligase (NAD+)